MTGAFENKTRGTVVASRVDRTRHLIDRLFGLLARPGLRPDEGLWLVPCRAIHTFGMRYAIDVVYLDRELVVVAVQESLPPFRIGRLVTSAHSVLEALPGTVAASRTAVGDQLHYFES